MYEACACIPQVAIRDAHEDLRRARDYNGLTAEGELQGARVSKQWLERYLTPDLKQAVARLSVFQGSFNTEGATMLQLTGQADDSEAVAAVIRQLCNLSLLQPAPLALQEAPSRYRMHKLVAGIAAELLEALSSDGNANFAQGSLLQRVRALFVPWTLHPPRSQPKDTLLDSVHALFGDWMLQLGSQLEAHFDQPGPNTLQHAQALLADEELNFQHLLKLLQSGAVKMDLVGLERLTLMAGALTRWGRLQLAAAFYQQALVRTLLVQGEDHTNTGVSFSNLGVVLRLQGKLAEAEEALGEALRIHLQVLGADHADTGASYANLGNVLWQQGKLAEAEEAHGEALRIHLQVLGADHADTGASYANLGIVLEKQGRLAEAEKAHRDALRVQLQALGADHSDTGKMYGNLGNVLTLQGKLAEAEEALREALRVQLQVLGVDHFSTGESFGNLGVVLRQQSKLAEAEEAHREALRVQLQVLGADHSHTRTSYNNLGIVLRQQGKLAEAEEALREASAKKAS
jgi:tetratricopeptide (TPR) repeat protein